MTTQEGQPALATDAELAKMKAQLERAVRSAYNEGASPTGGDKP